MNSILQLMELLKRPLWGSEIPGLYQEVLKKGSKDFPTLATVILLWKSAWKERFDGEKYAVCKLKQLWPLLYSSKSSLKREDSLDRAQTSNTTFSESAT